MRVEQEYKSAIRVRTTRVIRPQQSYASCSTPKARYRGCSRQSSVGSHCVEWRSPAKKTPKSGSQQKHQQTADDGFQFSDAIFKNRESAILANSPQKKRVIVQILMDQVERREARVQQQRTLQVKQRQDTSNSKQSDNFTPLVCMVKELLVPNRRKPSSRSPLVKLRRHLQQHLGKPVASQPPVQKLQGWQQPQPIFTDDLINYTRRMRRKRFAAPLSNTVPFKGSME